MTLHILSKQDTVLNKFIAQIRDKSVQKDSMRFRRNLERIGEITAYEISKELAYSPLYRRDASGRSGGRADRRPGRRGDDPAGRAALPSGIP